MNLLQILNWSGAIRYGWKYVFAIAKKNQDKCINTTKVSSKSIIKGILDFLSERLERDDLTVAVYPGNRKFIMPVYSKGKGIIGYAKVFTGRAKEVGKNEVRMLRKLALFDFQSGVIPSVIIEGDNNGQYIVVVSTKERLRNFKSITSLHIRWLIELFNETTSKVLFKESDYYHILQDQLSQIREYIGVGEYSWLEDITGKVIEDLCNKEISFGIAQREFPYHHALKIKGQERIFVIDWELGADSYPPYFDLYHCFLSSFRRNLSKDIIEDYIKRMKVLFFSKRSIRNAIFNYSSKIGLPEWLNLSYNFFILYLVDQCSIHLTWDKTDTMVKQKLAALKVLATNPKYDQSQWLVR
ncbi:TPA: hypothetical protein EYP70_04905 [Candidatus Bathyarchaeota archaeon]|nr:hypothetical protein [Candidatus Bathyarchaeota archaeon]